MPNPESKKILVVSRSFYPMNSPRSFRTTELVKEFSRQGHNVTLLTVKNKEVHEDFEKKYGVSINDMGPLHFSDIDTSKGGTLNRYLKRVVRRGLHLFFDYPNIEFLYRVKKALKKEAEYDLLISVAVPHPIHWGVAWAWRRTEPVANTWVADCGDPYMGATMDTFNKLFYFQFFEKWFCRKADYITVPFDNAKKGYYPEFRHKIEVIPQGFKFDEVELGKSESVKNEIPTFGYAGSLIPGGRDPRQFLEYLVKQDREFKFILYTKSVDLVKPFLKEGRGRIEIRDYIPREKLLMKFSEMDFLVNFENDSEQALPSKLIDYYLTGRPVLSVTSQGIDSNKVDQFLEGNYSNKVHFENMDRYRIENVCRQFLKLCET